MTCLVPHRKTAFASAVALVTALVAGCGGSDDGAAPIAPTSVAVGVTLVLTASGRLVSANRATPGTLVTGAATLYANTAGNAALSQTGGAAGPVLRDLASRF